MSSIYADTVYGHRPWGSNEERLTSEALAANLVGANTDVIRALRPPLPRVELFPARFGYRTEPLGITDVIDVNATFPNARVDYSGSYSGYQGTSYPSLNVW